MIWYMCPGCAACWASRKNNITELCQLRRLQHIYHIILSLHQLSHVFTVIMPTILHTWIQDHMDIYVHSQFDINFCVLLIRHTLTHKARSHNSHYGLWLAPASLVIDDWPLAISELITITHKNIRHIYSHILNSRTLYIWQQWTAKVMLSRSIIVTPELASHVMA